MVGNPFHEHTKSLGAEPHGRVGLHCFDEHMGRHESGIAQGQAPLVEFFGQQGGQFVGAGLLLLFSGQGRGVRHDDFKQLWEGQGADSVESDGFAGGTAD